MHDINTSANKLNSDLEMFSNWAFQWEMSFNLNPSKQVQEVIFSRKFKEVPQTPLVFNNDNASHCKSKKHLSIILDSKLTFEKHYKTVLSKTNRSIGLLHKLQNLLSMEVLISIYKVFLRSHLNCGDVPSD